MSVAAYQYLANAYIVDLITGWTEDEADAKNLLEAARRAASLSPSDHLRSGSGGENRTLERMLRLTHAHYFRAGFLSQMALNWFCLGEPERGLPLVSEALKLKPEAICCHMTHGNRGLAWPRPSR